MRRPGRFWRLSRSLFLLIAIVALGYSGWIYFAGYWHEHSESEAFDRGREARTGEPPPPPLTERFATAKLSIPRLRLTTIVEEGVGEETLRRAAGHIPETALPGQTGNVGVAAHRDTIFRQLRGIREHDRIVLSTLKTDYNYEVISTSIVKPDDVSVLAPSRGQRTLTLVTCYPFYFIGNAPKRFIVRAREIEEEMAKPQAGALVARRAAPRSDAKTQKARIEAAAALAQVDAKRATRQRAAAEAEAARRRSALSELRVAEAKRAPAFDQYSRNQPEQASQQKTELRLRLLGQLSRVFDVRDTPRGLLATVRDVDFSGSGLRRQTVDQVARIAAIAAAYPELRVEVDGHTDSAGTGALSERRAEAVRNVLVGNGLPASAVVAREFGNTRPLVSNANATGRQENRRVEIVISGDPIGNLASWDRTYTLTQR